jgi:hypothetical protein
MAKANQSGGEKIDFKKATSAQKTYWETLIGKKKLSADQLPESVSFNLYQLKAYLTEVETEFNNLKVPYAERSISILPIAYDEKSKITFTLTPAVVTADGTTYHQFNKKTKTSKASKKLKTEDPTTSYDFQLPPFNEGNMIP